MAPERADNTHINTPRPHSTHSRPGRDDKKLSRKPSSISVRVMGIAQNHPRNKTDKSTRS